MIIIGLIAALAGCIITAIGKSVGSTALTAFGAILCLLSGAVFLINAFTLL